MQDNQNPQNPHTVNYTGSVGVPNPISNTGGTNEQSSDSQIQNSVGNTQSNNGNTQSEPFVTKLAGESQNLPVSQEEEQIGKVHRSDMFEISENKTNSNYLDPNFQAQPAQHPSGLNEVTSRDVNYIGESNSKKKIIMYLALIVIVAFLFALMAGVVFLLLKS